MKSKNFMAIFDNFESTNRNSSLYMVTRLQNKWLKFYFRQRLLFSPRLPDRLRSSQTHWVWDLFPRSMRRLGHETGHSSSSTVEAKNLRSYVSNPSCAFMTWCLIMHGDNFTFSNFVFAYTYSETLKTKHFLAAFTAGWFWVSVLRNSGFVNPANTHWNTKSLDWEFPPPRNSL
jgi:hypothetical protein